MLAWTGFLTIGVILALLLSNRVAAVVALAGVPIVFALIAGFGPGEIGEFVADVESAGLRVVHRFGSYELHEPVDDYAVWVLART